MDQTLEKYLNEISETTDMNNIMTFTHPTKKTPCSNLKTDPSIETQMQSYMTIFLHY